MLKRVALDAMGGDYGYSVVIPAVLHVLASIPNVKFFLVGQQDKLEKCLESHLHAYSDRLEIVHANEVVQMDESPAQALRLKKDSSMRVAINLVKEGRAQACVSAGNTGALMAIARFVLKTLPGIDRPAIISTFPTKKKTSGVRVLDLGANIDVSPEILYQFAVMGSILSSASDNIPHPRVGLLNVGEEAIKGNELVKKANELFENRPAIHYVGYVEGGAIFDHVADVVICDGFVGNITLKACEGISRLIMHYVKDVFEEAWWSKLLAIPAWPVLKRLRRRLDPSQHNGATLIGLNGIVIKSHGSANVQATIAAIREAMLEIDKNIPQLIKEKLQHILVE